MKPGDKVKFKEEAKWDPKKYPYEVDPNKNYVIEEIHDHPKGAYVDLINVHSNYPLSAFELTRGASPSLDAPYGQCKIATFYDKMTRLYWKIIVFLHRTFHKLRLPICEGYEGPCFKLGKRRRLCTRYIEERRNWTHQCQDCYDGTNEYYLDLMKDVY